MFTRSLLSLCSSDVQVQQTGTAGRVHCSTLGTCEFYSHCIETNLECGSEGLMLSYAQRRCNAINNLNMQRPGRPPCSTCVNRTAFRWAHHIEQCFQEKLLTLIESYQSNDPISCLAWEREAALEMNKCYSQTYPLNTHISELSESELRILASTFQIGGEYYDFMVNRGMPEVVKSIGNSIAHELVTKPPMHRLLFCIKARKTVYPTGVTPALPEDYIEIVKNLVDKKHVESLSNYHYIGRDSWHGGNPCEYNQPPGINYVPFEFNLIALFVENPDNHPEMSIPMSFQWRSPSSVFYSAAVYEMTSSSADSNKPPRLMTLCGDGIRQATEECDTEGSSEGCEMSCRVKDNFECSTARLEQGQCWSEVCGNGRRTRGEECDDGNLQDGDGCDSTCHITTETHTCIDKYNASSVCSPHSLQVEPVSRQRRSLSATIPSQEPAAISNAAEKPSILKPLLATSSAGIRSVSSSLMVTCTLALLAVGLIPFR